jgi:hypothetical protein
MSASVPVSQLLYASRWQIPAILDTIGSKGHPGEKIPQLAKRLAPALSRTKDFCKLSHERIWHLH